MENKHSKGLRNSSAPIWGGWAGCERLSHRLSKPTTCSTCKSTTCSVHTDLDIRFGKVWAWSDSLMRPCHPTVPTPHTGLSWLHPSQSLSRTGQWHVAIHQMFQWRQGPSCALLTTVAHVGHRVLPVSTSVFHSSSVAPCCTTASTSRLRAFLPPRSRREFVAFVSTGCI